jgi:hypothetical protein
MKKSKKLLLKITGISEESFEIIRFELNMAVLRIRNKIDPNKIIRIQCCPVVIRRESIG